MRRRVFLALIAVVLPVASSAQETPAAAPPFMGQDGVSHTAPTLIPFSDLASPQQKDQFLRPYRPRAPGARPEPIPFTKENAGRLRARQSATQVPKLDAQARYFDVTTVKSELGGVPVYISTPAKGVAPRNRDKAIINLHGGSFVFGADEMAREGAAPIAGLGGFEVVSVDYALAPEHQFPAASNDVEKVYRALLERYKPASIGIMGCSTGALLAAEAVVQFERQGLPRPGGIGLFGEGALAKAGDSYYVAPILGGFSPRPLTSAIPLESDWYFPPGSERIPAAFPAEHPEMLKRFPPTLLISGTRDSGLSQVVTTHARLVDAEAEAELHVWDGVTHCAYTATDADPEVPEMRQTWDVIVKFFERRLSAR